MKVQRTISIDYKVHKTLQDNPKINVSALCNKILKDKIKEMKLK